LAANKLMDYSMLFIKVKKAEVNHPLKRMPALIYTKDDAGEMVLTLREIDTEEDKPFKNKSKTPSVATSEALYSEFS
jgi:hypothetical protein